MVMFFAAPLQDNSFANFGKQVPKDQLVGGGQHAVIYTIIHLPEHLLDSVGRPAIESGYLLRGRSEYAGKT